MTTHEDMLVGALFYFLAGFVLLAPHLEYATGVLLGIACLMVGFVFAIIFVAT